MNRDALAVAAVFLAAAALVLAVPSIFLSLQDDGGDAVYTLYFGMDPDATQEEMDSLEGDVREAIVGHGNGYTMYWAEGGYAADGAVVHGQHTLVVKIAFTDRPFVDSLVGDIKEAHGLDSVMVQCTAGEVWLS